MGTVNIGLFTSTTDQWPTPDDLFSALDKEFSFTLDPCASDANAKCAVYFTESDDGLSLPWAGSVFMNPPYGRAIGHWVAKAHKEADEGATVVCLIPARTDTAYWHDHAMHASEIRFIRGRLNFSCDRQDERKLSGESKAHNAPFPSVIVVFKPGHHGNPQVSAIDRNGSALDIERTLYEALPD